MKAVILGAGSSTRTYPLTLTRPKPLLKAANKTIIEHNLNQLSEIVDEVIIVVGYKKEMIKKYLKNIFKGKGLKITYVEQKERLGTAHALLQAEPFLDEKFIVLNGDDIYFKGDIKKCLRHKYSVLAKRVNDPERFGVCILDKNYVKKIIEKPKRFISNLANTGLYVLNKDIFLLLKNIKKQESFASQNKFKSKLFSNSTKFKTSFKLYKQSKRGEFEIPSIINRLAEKEKIKCIITEKWVPISYAWNLLEANEFLLKQIKKSIIEGKIEKGVMVKGKVLIGKNTIIKSGAYIEGNTAIGENCTIGPNCYIRAFTSIGNNCKIGNAVEIKNSILFDNTHAGHLSYVGDSVLGENVNLGAGTITANLRHDNNNVKSLIKNELIDSRRRKLGTIIGDNAHTGIHTSIYPGRKIGRNASTLPGAIVKKDVKSRVG